MVRHSTKIVATISLISFLGSLVVFGVFYGIVSKQKTEHQTHAQESAEAVVHKASLQKLMQTLEDTKTERESLFTRIVENDEVINFVELVEKIGEEQGVVLDTKSLGTEDINEYFESFIITLDITGSHSRILQTLSLLEKLPYQVAILNLGLRKNDDSEWTGPISLSVTKFKKNENY